MGWFPFITEVSIATLIIFVGLLFLSLSFIKFGTIRTFDSGDRRVIRNVGFFLLALGVFLHLSPNFDLLGQKLPGASEKYSLETYRKDGDKATKKSVFSSSERIYVSFNFNNPDIEENRKLIRWTTSGQALNTGRYKWVGNSGEITIGTFQPGSYEVRAFFYREDGSYGLLVKDSFEVKP